jgi:hypothetical protein
MLTEEIVVVYLFRANGSRESLVCSNQVSDAMSGQLTDDADSASALPGTPASPFR